MIRTLLALMILASALQAAKLINYKVYERSDHTDLLISFDTVYTGKTSKYERDGKTYLLFPNVNTEKEKHFNFSTNYLKSVHFYKSSNRTLVEIDAPSAQIDASIVPPGYGLRLRFKPSATPIPVEDYPKALRPDRPKVGEHVEDLSEKYMIMGLFVASLLLLWLIIKLMAGRKASAENSRAAAEILYTKALDNRNKLVLLAFNGKHYLVLMGATGNVLIDSITAESPAQDFSAMLKSNTDTLEKYLATNENKRIRDYKDKLAKK